MDNVNKSKELLTCIPDFAEVAMRLMQPHILLKLMHFRPFSHITEHKAVKLMNHR